MNTEDTAVETDRDRFMHRIFFNDQQGDVINRGARRTGARTEDVDEGER